jgi:hypothetical protein
VLYYFELNDFDANFSIFLLPSKITTKMSIALFLLTAGQTLKNFALNIKCASTIIQDISDEADGSN